MDNETLEIIILLATFGGIVTAFAVFTICHEYWLKHYSNHNPEQVNQHLISPTYAGALRHEQEDDTHNSDSTHSNS